MTGPRVRDEGLTLIEVVVVVSILMLISTGIYSFFDGLTTRTTDVDNRTFSQAAARYALRQMSSDLRQAYSGDPADPAIDSFASSAVTFTSPDRATPFHLRIVSYRLTGTDLERSTVSSTDTDGSPWVYPGGTPSWETVLRNVKLFSLSATDENRVTTTTPSLIRNVDITIDIDPDPTRPPGSQRFTAKAQLRSHW